MTQDVKVSGQTLALLEARLRKVAFALTGTIDVADWSSDARYPAATRLRTLERQLATLSSKSSTATNVLDLHQRKPFLFHPASDRLVTDELAPVGLASLVVAHARSYQQLSQQLSSLDNASVPDPADLVPLVDLQGRIDAAARQHSNLARKTAELRTRSARLLEDWYESGVLEMSERWTDWEERLRDIEILVRRVEAAKKREDELV